MTSDQAAVLWPFIAAPGLPPTGAQMGIDLLSGGSFYADPLGWVLRDDVPVTNPNVIVLRQTRPRQVRHHQGVLPADDGLRLPHPGPGRPQGRVRAAVPGPRRASRSRSAPACRPGSTRSPSARSATAGTTSTAQRRSARAAVVFARWLTLIRGLVGSQRVGATRCRSGPPRRRVVKAALRDPHRLRRRQPPAGRDHHPAAVAPARPTPPPSWSTECRYADHAALPRRDPAAARRPRPARRPAPWPACSTTTPPSTSTGPPRSSPCRLSRLEPLGDEAVGIALTCLNSWGRGMRELAAAGDLRIVVRDESGSRCASAPRRSSPSTPTCACPARDGDIQFAIAHKPSDLLSVGDTGSQAVAIAKDLLHLADIKILHGQDHGRRRRARRPARPRPDRPRRRHRLGHAGKGRALWCVGDQQYKVQTVLHPARDAPHLHQRRPRRRGPR